MSLHSRYMIAISILVLLVFAVLLHSLIRHHRINRCGPPRFLGVTGTIQWIWTLIPLLILAFVGSELVEEKAMRPTMESGAGELARRTESERAPPATAQTSGPGGAKSAGKARIVRASLPFIALR